MAVGKVQLEIAFGRHAEAEHADFVARRFEAFQPDVYIPENCGWTQDQQAFYDQVAGVPKMAFSLLKGSGHPLLQGFQGSELEVISGTRVAVLFVDIPSGSPELLDDICAEKALVQTKMAVLRYVGDDESFQLDLQAYERYLDAFIAHHRSREEIVVRNLRRELELVLGSREGDLRALMSFGIGHRDMDLSGLGESFQVTRQYDPDHVETYRDEILALMRRGVKADVDLVQKAALADVLEMLALKMTESDESIIRRDVRAFIESGGIDLSTNAVHTMDGLTTSFLEFALRNTLAT